MKALISYSINDEKQYIVTLLSTQLRKRNFSVSPTHYTRSRSDINKLNIQRAQLFIGIITGQGYEKKRILDEWEIAKKYNTPNILLIENTVKIDPRKQIPYIEFDARNPNTAIERINAIINDKNNKPSQDSNTLTWVLGGAALIAAIAFLSKDK